MPQWPGRTRHVVTGDPATGPSVAEARAQQEIYASHFDLWRAVHWDVYICHVNLLKFDLMDPRPVGLGLLGTGKVYTASLQPSYCWNISALRWMELFSTLTPRLTEQTLNDLLVLLQAVWEDWNTLLLLSKQILQTMFLNNYRWHEAENCSTHIPWYESIGCHLFRGTGSCVLASLPFNVHCHRLTGEQCQDWNIEFLRDPMSQILTLCPLVADMGAGPTFVTTRQFIGLPLICSSLFYPVCR